MFEAFTRCLHVTNPANYVRDREAVGGALKLIGATVYILGVLFGVLFGVLMEYSTQ
jgi:hypothetical protein